MGTHPNPDRYYYFRLSTYDAVVLVTAEPLSKVRKAEDFGRQLIVLGTSLSPDPNWQLGAGQEGSARSSQIYDSLFLVHKRGPVVAFNLGLYAVGPGPCARHGVYGEERGLLVLYYQY